MRLKISLVIVLALAIFAPMLQAQDFSPSVHYPLGVARSYNAPFGQPERNYAVGWMGATVFLYTVDGGRMLLNGVTVSYADRIPQDQGTVAVQYVPLAVRAFKKLYVGPTFGTAQIHGSNGPRLAGYKTVGIQASWCLFNCGDR